MSDNERKLIITNAKYIISYYMDVNLPNWCNQSKRIGFLAKKYNVSPKSIAEFLESKDIMIPKEFKNIVEKDNEQKMTVEETDYLDNNEEVQAELARYNNDKYEKTEEQFIEYCDSEEEEKKIADTPQWVDDYKKSTAKMRFICDYAKKNGRSTIDVAYELRDKYGLEIPKRFSEESREMHRIFGRKGAEKVHGVLKTKDKTQDTADVINSANSKTEHYPQIVIIALTHEKNLISERIEQLQKQIEEIDRIIEGQVRS